MPVFLEEPPGCRTTQDFLKRFLPLVPASIPLEVETYTFDVLPEELKTPTVVESIVREIQWVEACRAARPGPDQQDGVGKTRAKEASGGQGG